MPRLHRWLAAPAVCVAVLLPAAPASAHVVLDRSEVAAGTTADLEFRAPLERQGATNQRIYALVPGPVRVVSCAGPSAAWRCSLDTTSRPGDTFVTWETPVAGSPQDLRFRFRVEVPATTTTGERKLPVVQTYSDGSVSRWIDDGEPTPAPRLTVIGVGQRPAPPSPAPTATAHGGDSPSGGTAPAPAASPTTAPSSAAAAAPSSAPSSAVAPGTAAPAAGEPSTAPDLGGGEPAASGGGGSGALVAVLGVLVVAGLGAALAVRRRRA